jgi:hypothetical protein
MESKYYTPKIEEFFVGLEFEFYNRHLDVWDLKSWEIEFVNKFHFSIDKCRIKCLDQKDIESLGFEDLKFIADKHASDKVKKAIVFTNGNHMIQWYGEDGLSISLIDSKQIMFAGNIKNKSELKRVLKMIGYEHGN